MKRFSGRVAVVTGGGGGIGSAICQRLAEEGADVVVTDMNAEAAQDIANKIVTSGGAAYAIEADISDSRSCADLISKVMNRQGRIDILANNAGINRRGNLLALTEDDWHASFAVNLNSMFYLCRAVIPHMIEAGGGAIVNTASQWGLYPAPNHIAYNVTKAAVASFTQNLARDYAPHKIRVNAVCPGEIHTPMLEAGSHARWKDHCRPRQACAFRTHRQARRGGGAGGIPRLGRSAVHVRVACRNYRSSSGSLGFRPLYTFRNQ